MRCEYCGERIDPTTGACLRGHSRAFLNSAVSHPKTSDELRAARSKLTYLTRELRALDNRIARLEKKKKKETK